MDFFSENDRWIPDLEKKIMKELQLQYDKSNTNTKSYIVSIINNRRLKKIKLVNKRIKTSHNQIISSGGQWME